MSAAKIAITLDEDLVARLDQLVAARQFTSRSRAVQDAVREKLERLDRTRLACECEKLDPRFEQQMAEQGMGADAEIWPEY
ncbi:MAG: ribbon-helix-helix domain-containing protein [Pirellulales bacterium]